MARIDGTGVDLRRLRYFLAVCEHGGFSRAAAVIGIAQPALTRQMQLLEQDLGVALFTRNGRSAVPSEAGQMLLAEARGPLGSLDQLVGRLRRDFAGGPARIVLGVCPTIAPLFLEDVIEVLRHSPGNPTLSVIEAYSGDLRVMMRAGRLDLALSYDPGPDPELRSAPLVTERLVVATRTASLSNRLSPRDLARLRLILPSRIHQLRRIIDAVCDRHHLRLTPALELDSLGAVKAMLAEEDGGFATILPLHSVTSEAAAGRLVLRPIDDPGMVRTIALVQPAETARPLPPGLADALTARAREIRATLETLP